MNSVYVSLTICDEKRIRGFFSVYYSGYNRFKDLKSNFAKSTIQIDDFIWEYSLAENICPWIPFFVCTDIS